MGSFFESILGILLLSLVSVSAFSQQLDISSPPTLEAYPFFNSTFIKENSVKSITSKVMYKSPNRRLNHALENQCFEFNRLGNIEKLTEVNSIGRKSVVTFFHNKRGDLITKHYVSQNTDELKSITYNTDGRIIKKEKSNGKTGLLISEEKFKYETSSPNQFKRYYLNDEDLTYKYEVVDLNGDGDVLESRSRYIRGVNREYSSFEYENGVLVSASFNKKDVTRREVKYQMSYDSNGLLQKTNVWKDAAPLFRYEYLYEDGVVIAILRKNLQSQEIKITKFMYVFY